MSDESHDTRYTSYSSSSSKLVSHYTAQSTTELASCAPSACRVVPSCTSALVVALAGRGGAALCRRQWAALALLGAPGSREPAPCYMHIYTSDMCIHQVYKYQHHACKCTINTCTCSQWLFIGYQWLSLLATSR